MKYLFIILTICATFICKGQPVKQGDNIKTEFRKIATPYYYSAPVFTAWAEGADILLIGDKPNPDDCDFVFIALHDTTFIGVFKTKEPAIFMFDTTGSSVLNSTSEFFLLPAWTVKKNTKIVSSDKAILLLLDKMYEQTLQANELELDQKAMKEYQRYRTDTSLSNRHIALLFDNYQSIISETSAKGEKAPADICIPLLKSLSAECLSLYNRIPAIVCIYMGEALQNAGLTDQAREHFKMSLQIYPTSIPLLVYNYRFEKDPIKKKEKLAELKKKYSKHWMVKDL